MTAAGVGTGDAVVVLSPLRNATVAAYLAILRTGAFVVMPDRRCGVSDIRAACENARSTVGFAATCHIMQARNRPSIAAHTMRRPCGSQLR